MASKAMIVEFSEYRPCIVSDLRTRTHKKAFFHRWSEISRPIEASLMIGGAPAGIMKDLFGVVEFEDGTIERVAPERIKFYPHEDFKEVAFPPIKDESEGKNER